MLTILRYWFLDFLFLDLVKARLDLQADRMSAEYNSTIYDLEQRLTDQRKTLQRYEDMLANKNFKATIAQQLYITDHAVHQYRKRIGFGGSDDELRKMIYKLTLRHLASMDRLPDGHYRINDKAAVRVKDNTVCTVVHPTKWQS